MQLLAYLAIAIVILSIFYMMFLTSIGDWVIRIFNRPKHEVAVLETLVDDVKEGLTKSEKLLKQAERDLEAKKKKTRQLKDKIHY